MAFQQGSTYKRRRDGEASQAYVALVVADPDACTKCSQCVEHCYQEAIELRPCAAHGNSASAR
jgi:NAD-dependent dihydropyrimidine dehydrogenase PreA subunit